MSSKPLKALLFAQPFLGLFGYRSGDDVAATPAAAEEEAE